MLEIIILALAAIAIWLISAFVGTKIRYADYMRREVGLTQCSFEVFASIERDFGKYRNGEFGG